MTNDSIQDMTLMRLLVISMNFFVECRASLDSNSNIACINIKYNATLLDELKNAQARLFANNNNNNNNNTVATLIDAYERNLPYINELFECDRNKPDKEHYMLTKDEILAIRLWTDEPVCSIVKLSHQNGISCQFRILCTLIYSGLQKLKDCDSGFKIEELKLKQEFLYTGIRDVVFDHTRFKTVISKFKQNENNIKQNNDDYCLMYLTFTSATIDLNVAKRGFLQSTLENDDAKSILFEIEIGPLDEIVNIVYGDVSWISVNSDEQEVLISPAVMDPYINKQKGATFKLGNTKVSRFGVTLKGINNVSCLWRRVRQSKVQTL